jgi:Mg2+ and Co2+ transporter CorA
MNQSLPSDGLASPTSAGAVLIAFDEDDFAPATLLPLAACAPLGRNQPPFIASNTGGARRKQSRATSFTDREARSAADHFWAVDHNRGEPVKLRAFANVDALIDFIVNAREQSPVTATGGHINLEDTACDTPRFPRGARESVGSSSSSSSSSSGDSTPGQLAHVCWIDVQTKDGAAVERLLSIFEDLQRETVDNVQDLDGVDTLQHFADSGYVFANVQCKGVTVVDDPATAPTGGTHTSLSGESKPVIVSVIAFDDWCITVHAAPFHGLADTMRCVHDQLSLKKHHRRRNGRGGHGLRRHLTSICPVAAVGAGFARQERAASEVPDGGDPLEYSAADRPLMSIAWLLATLLDFAVEASLPDPAAVLHEVDLVDEMVLLVVAGDQRDLLRRIGRLRRVISAQRSALFRKERFLTQCLSPAMRTSFVARSDDASEQYRHTLAHVYRTAERIEAARDVLTQANSNFVSNISLETAQISNRMSQKVKALSQLATVCLPLTIVTGLFGMNVTVPYDTKHYDSIAPFIVIILLLGLWLLLCAPFVRKTWQKGISTMRHAPAELDELVLDAE